METVIIKNAIKCLKCGDVIESRHSHDYQQCTCKTISINGGRKSQHVGGDLEYISFEPSVVKKVKKDSQEYRDLMSGQKESRDKELDELDNFVLGLVNNIAGK